MEDESVFKRLEEEISKEREESIQDFNDVYGWTEEAVIARKVEPPPPYVAEENVDRWITDLLKNPNYVPSKELSINYISKALKSEESHWRDLNMNLFNREDRYNPEVKFVALDKEPNQEQIDVAKKYKSAESEAVNTNTYRRHLVSPYENHGVFKKGALSEDFDDLSLNIGLTRQLASRLENSDHGAEVARWFLNNAGEYLSYTDEGSIKNYFYMIRSMVGEYGPDTKEFYQDFTEFVASMEKPDPNKKGRMEPYSPEELQNVANRETGFLKALLEDQMGTYATFTTKLGKKVEMDSYDHWDFARVTYGFGNQRTDFLDGIVLSVALEDDIEFRNKVLGQVFGEKGPAEVLNYLREVSFNELYPEDERLATKKMLEDFWKPVVPEVEGQTVLDSVNTFYDVVAEEHHPMTEKTEGNKRVAFLHKLFEDEGITEEDLIVDIACGTGWLKHRLEELGYNTIGVDINEKLLSEARERFGEQGFYQAPWDDLSSVEGIGKAKVAVINGRSVHNAEGFPGMHGIMMELEGADLIVFDALDPTTGGRAEGLDVFRQSLENFGFKKEWLDQYMWQGVGSIDGKILSDRWYPPEEWWRGIAGLYGYAYEKVIEENYDGSGTDNMVQILRRVENEAEREKLKKRALGFFMEEMSDQPKNPNGYKLDNWPKPHRSTKEFV